MSSCKYNISKFPIKTWTRAEIENQENYPIQISGSILDR